MSLVGADRGTQIYGAVVANNPKCADMTQGERDTLLRNLQALFTADTRYLTDHTEVNPGTLSSQPGQAVSTAGSATNQTGQTTAPKAISGIGTIS